MHLVSEFLVVFTYYGLGIIAVSLLVGHLLDRKMLRKGQQQTSERNTRV